MSPQVFRIADVRGQEINPPESCQWETVEFDPHRSLVSSLDHPWASIRNTSGMVMPSDCSDPSGASGRSFLCQQANLFYDSRKCRDVRTKLLVVLLRSRRRDLERHGLKPLAHVGHGENASDFLC